MREATMDAAETADRGRHRTGLTHPALRLKRDADPRARREPVSDERRLECHDRFRFAYLVRDDDHGIAPSLATQRAATSTASSGPPTRKPAASASPAPVVSTTSPPTAGSSTSFSPRTTIPRAPRLTTAVRASP